jgi:two-component system, LuxR family, response regulator FixJ
MTDGEAGPVVHVVDDDPAMRDSLAFLLETAGHEARLYDSAVAFLEDPGRGAPGCIVTDVRMPEMTGLELVRRLKADGVETPVIVITGHADVPLAVEAMKAGVADFIEKPFDGDALLAAIGAALREGSDRQRAAEERAAVLERLASLSGREREVLDGLVAGHANKVIADDLQISPRTVEVYRANVMSKMRAASLSELVRMTLVAQR